MQLLKSDGVSIRPQRRKFAVAQPAEIAASRPVLSEALIGWCWLTSRLKVDSLSRGKLTDGVNMLESTDGGRTDDITYHRALRRRVVRPHQRSTDGGIWASRHSI